jgi:transcriptional regulator with XRE-family HTH domain
MKLKKYLEERGMSQTFFAKKVGVNPTHLSRWIGGKTVPRIDYILKIEEATNGEVSSRDWLEK